MTTAKFIWVFVDIAVRPKHKHAYTKNGPGGTEVLHHRAASKHLTYFLLHFQDSRCKYQHKSKPVKTLITNKPYSPNIMVHMQFSNGKICISNARS